jgi:RimJ/RimL family protein N-acetyltransferase
MIQTHLVDHGAAAIAYLNSRGWRVDDERFQGSLVFRGSDIVGACGVDHYQGEGGGCVCHSDGDGHWSVRSLREFFEDRIFGAMKCRRVSTECLASNFRAIKGLTSIGFKVEGVKRCASPNGEDILMLGMLREEFKLKRHRYG